MVGCKEKPDGQSAVHQLVEQQQQQSLQALNSASFSGGSNEFITFLKNNPAGHTRQFDGRFGSCGPYVVHTCSIHMRPNN